MCVVFSRAGGADVVYGVFLTESAGALLQTPEFCSPVRCVQSLVSRRALRFMLQNLQQGKQLFTSVFIPPESIRTPKLIFCPLHFAAKIL